jgi:uncharacterized SAM-binding protein YcdF (DUF218 family)
MEIETLNTMNQGMYLSLMMIKVTALIVVLFAIAGFAIYLAGITWLCFMETRWSQTAQPTARRESSPHNWKAMPRIPNSQVGTILSTSRALMCEASPTALARFE